MVFQRRKRHVEVTLTTHPYFSPGEHTDAYTVAKKTWPVQDFQDLLQLPWARAQDPQAV